MGANEIVKIRFTAKKVWHGSINISMSFIRVPPNEKSMVHWGQSWFRTRFAECLKRIVLLQQNRLPPELELPQIDYYPTSLQELDDSDRGLDN